MMDLRTFQKDPGANVYWFDAEVSRETDKLFYPYNSTFIDSNPAIPFELMLVDFLFFPAWSSLSVCGKFSVRGEAVTLLVKDTEEVLELSGWCAGCSVAHL